MTTWSVNLNPNRLDADLAPEGLRRATPGAFAQLEALGAGGVRVDLHWAALEPEPGRINAPLLRWYRDFFAECGRRGLQVYALLYHPPAWALDFLPGNSLAFQEAWRGFCKLVAEEYAGMLALIQPWNEPNNFLAAFKRDPGLFHTRRVGPVDVPTGVDWETLVGLFRIAREELPGSRLVFNVLANLCPFLPARCGWLDWEQFTDQFLERAAAYVDVIALDHYPDTWAPGTGPYEWACLDVARRRVADPFGHWYGKAVIVGELGYSSAPNFHLLSWPFRLGRFFPGDRDEGTMARWYAHALAAVERKLAADSWVNCYELFDPLRELEGHPVLALENHFGLVRRDYTRKPAFETVRAAFAGEHVVDVMPWRDRPPLYWHLARWSRRLEDKLRPAPMRLRVLESVVPAASVVEEPISQG